MNNTIELRWVNKISFQNGERVSTPILQYREKTVYHMVDWTVKSNPFHYDRWSEWREVPVTNEEIY